MIEYSFLSRTLNYNDHLPVIQTTGVNWNINFCGEKGTLIHEFSSVTSLIDQ